MSGTSLDGLDIAYVSFHNIDSAWTYELLKAETILYESEFASQIKNIANSSALDYAVMHVQFGKYCAEQINKFILKHHIL